ncbi:hypothetical protein FOL47_005110 [Perkinsus chesapeaki]|uniref:S1 motif domain-containing protein n=1 Tax=Perkinsus chesapeaki TaxID=330153 RepID=A0A7J6LYT0_PERCH|nr:hypothetical protein FOL47_005110 [Perkinsus chesapeaki]
MAKTNNAKRAPSKGGSSKGSSITKKKSAVTKQTSAAAIVAAKTAGLTHVPSITYKDLKVGTQLQAAVQDISSEALTLDLPFNKVGFVKGVANMVDEGDISKHIKQANVTLKSYKPEHRFHKGQLVSAVVIENDATGREASVHLSLLPSVLNAGLTPKSLRKNMWLSASVLTEEAHGYVLSFGIDGITGFLKKSELPAHAEGVETVKGDNPLLELSVRDNDAPEADQMKLGTLLNVRILEENAANKTSIQCSAKVGKLDEEDKISNNTSSAVKMNLLKVGTPVEAKVTHVCVPIQAGKKKANKKSAGIEVGFMGPLKGVVHQYHLVHPILNQTDMTMSTNLKVGQSVSARVLAVLADPSSHNRAVYLTLLPNILQWKTVESQVEPGVTLEAARVIDLIPKDCTRFVDGGNLLVAHATRCALPYRQPGAVGKKTDVRVLGSNLLEMTIQVSAEEKVLAASVVNLQQLAPGMVFDKAVIEHFDNEKGLIVRLSDFVTGRVPKEQCTDQGNQKKLPKRYTEEKAEIRVRVLGVDPVTLTAKKSLVGRPDDEEPPRALTRNADAAVGDVFVGYVSKMLDHGGCYVKFFGEAFGLMPVVSEGCAHSGAYVKVRVTSKKDSPKGTRLRLQQINGMEDAVIGEITKIGDLLAIEKLEGPAKCSGGRQGVKIRCEGGVDVLVPVMQLADDPDMAVAVMERVEKMQDLQDFPVKSVLVTAVLNNGTIEGTCKPVLVEDAKYRELLGVSQEEIPAKIKVGEGLVGFVSNVTTFGAFVKVGGISGLVPKPKLAEGFVDEVSEAVEVGQTVTTAVVSSVDAERNMFKLDMQPRPIAGVAELGAREQLRAEAKLALEKWLGGGKLPKRGEVVTATVGKKKPYGWMLELKEYSEAAGLLLKLEGSDEIESGKKMKVLVVDVDVVRSVVYTCKEPEKSRKRNRDSEEFCEGKVMTSRGGYSTVLLGSDVLLVTSGPRSISQEDTVKVKVHAGVGVLVNEDKKAKKARRSAGEGGNFAADVSVVEEIEELVDGKELSMEIVGHTPTRVILVAAPNIRATMHVAHCRPGVEGKLAKEYPIGSVVPVRVLGSSRVAAYSAAGTSQWNISVRDPKTAKEECKLYKWNPASLCGASVVGCAVSSVNEDEMFVTVDVPGVEMSSHSQLEAGKLGNMTKSQKAKFFRQHLGDHEAANSTCKVMVGKIRAVDLPKAVEEYKIGHVLTEEVRAFDVVPKKKIELTAVEEVSEGTVVTTARVSNNKTAPIQRMLDLPGGHKGRLHATMACDDWRANPLAPLTPGMLAPAVKVISVGSGRKPTEVCLKSISQAHVKSLPKGAKDLKEGGKVSGYVASVSSSGLFVALSPWLTGRVLLGNVAEHPVTPEEAGKLYPVGTAVKEIAITSVDVTKNQVGLAIVNKDKSKVEEIEEDAIMYGQVSRKDRDGKGLFVRISGTGGRHGYCAAKDLFDGKGDNKALKEAVGSYKIGTKVRCRILSVKDDGKINIGLAKKYFPEDNDVVVEDAVGEEEEEDSDVEMEEELAETSEAPSPSIEESEEDDEEEEEEDLEVNGGDSEVGQFGFAEGEMFAEEEEDDEEEDEEADGTNGEPEHDAMEDSDDSEGEEEEKAGTGKKSARQKARERREREKETREIELANASGDWKRNPRGPDDFERLVLMSCSASSTPDMPSASEVWIQYMGYWMQMAEVQRARDCAERGIKQRLGFRDEQDRLNLWIAYLNLEAHVRDLAGGDGGGDGRSLLQLCVEGGRKRDGIKRVEDLFKRAASYNDSKKVHMAMCDVWSRAGAEDLALDMYKRTAEKFGHSKKVWLKYLEFLYSTGKLSEARQNCLPRALRLTEKRKHSLIATRAAKLEYKYGTVERGKTIFESLLASQPKRLDIWSVYLDEHINANKEDPDAVRSVFDRAITLKLKPAKVKFFFKRWVGFEQLYGDVEHLELVKDKARGYVMALEKSRRADDIGEEGEEGLGNKVSASDSAVVHRLCLSIPFLMLSAVHRGLRAIGTGSALINARKVPAILSNQIAAPAVRIGWHQPTAAGFATWQPGQRGTRRMRFSRMGTTLVPSLWKWYDTLEVAVSEFEI